MNQAEGTFTFVFTDIEGSTRLLRTLGDDYPRLLAEHDRILVEAAQAHGGRAFGSEGDAQHLVFGDVDGAIAACVAAQRELAAHPWPEGNPVRVRMGIHSGAATPKGDDFGGLALHETARIAAAGHGGQVLLSATSRELARHQVPAGVDFRDLGEHHLKDFDEAVRLYQLDIDGLPDEFPPLRTRSATKARLPTQLTDFVGRAEVEAVGKVLAGARIVTLTGPGGTGKTRLAIQVASEVAHGYADGTWFVALDAVTDPTLVASEIAMTLGLVGADAPIDRLVAHLGDKSVLLVIDNMEQVIAAATDVARLTRECPALKLLITSRIPLEIYGESEFPVPALGVPPAEEAMDASSLQRYEAANLFVTRAIAARPGFSVDDGTASIVADIVRRLDGLPLAIELAAARLRMLPLPALRDRLDDRLATLTGGGRDRPGRQQTLRGAIEWSHELLDDPDRALFARLGVIAGTAALPQIDEVCGPADELGRDVFDGIESLSRQSLLRLQEDGMNGASEPRFGMLATIREYARERLDERGEAELCQRRRAMTYLRLAEDAAPHLQGAEGREWNARLEADHDDLRAALDWIVANDEAELGMRMISALWRFWQVRGHLLEGERRCEAVLGLPGVAAQPPSLVSRGEGAAGSIAYWRNDVRATHEHYAAALAAAREADEPALLAESLYNMGFGASPEDTGLIRYAEGRPYFEESLAIYRSLGDRPGEASALWALHQAVEAEGDFEMSERLARETLEIARELEDPFRIGWAAFTLAVSEFFKDPGPLGPEALALLSESLDVFVAADDSGGVLFNVATISQAALRAGRVDGAWRLVGASKRLREESGAALFDTDFERSVQGVRMTPGTAEEARLYELGRSMTTAETVDLAGEVLEELASAD